MYDYFQLFVRVYENWAGLLRDNPLRGRIFLNLLTFLFKSASF